MEEQEGRRYSLAVSQGLGHPDGLMGYGKDYGFYSKSSLWVLQSWEVVRFKNTTPSGERPGGLEARTAVTGHHSVLRKMVVAWSRVSAAKVVKREWSWDIFYRQRKCDL